jgi:DNA-binding PadR family transcriptional regulator
MDAKSLCLAVLTQGDASGYEIKKTLEEPPLGQFQDTGFGSIYPALTRLTEDGLVQGTQMAQEKRPDKKVYSITEAGRQALIAALMEPPSADKFRSDFLFVLFLGHLLADRHVAALVDQRIAYYEAQIERMEGCSAEHRPPGQQLVHGFGLALYRAAAGYLRENRDLLGGEAADPPAALVAE